MMPSGMDKYLSLYGWHFSKKMCDWAVKRMRDRNGNPIQPIDKEKLETMLKGCNVELSDTIGYDGVYVINMARSDFYGSSITDDTRLTRYVGDYLNDEDGYDGIAFTRFYADTIAKGIPIIWEDMI